MKPKYTRAPEIMWIAMGIMSLTAGIHKTYKFGFKEGWYFFSFVIITGIMWFIRREVRKNREKKANSNQNV